MANGLMSDDPDDIKQTANDFFKLMYTIDLHIIPDELINMMHTPITDEINNSLCEKFSDSNCSNRLVICSGIWNCPGLEFCVGT